ncbi:MAG TPA: BatD family protein, partial [Polyangia bacterium]|nr:BatD family protein [Polyangia bacterium]
MRPPGWCSWRIGLLAIAVGAVAPRAAQAATFTAEIDRDAVAPGEPFIYRITLNMGDGDAENFRPPDFHGFQVQQAQGPSKSTSVQFVFGSNQQSVQSTYAWTYQLVLPAGAKGPLTIGAAHVTVGGRALTTNSVRVRVGAASSQSPPGGSPPPDPNRLFQRLFPGAQGLGPGRDREAPSEVASSPAPAFIRVIPDKTRAFVGEQVTVAWYLYVAEVPNRFGQTSEPHTDGFWSEEIPSTNPQGRLAFGEPQSVAGRPYNVALLFKKALFPLAPGKLTITPMEAEIAHG